MRAMTQHPIAAMGRSYSRTPTTLQERAMRAIGAPHAPGKSNTAFARIPRWISLLPP